VSYSETGKKDFLVVEFSVCGESRDRFIFDFYKNGVG